MGRVTRCCATPIGSPAWSWRNDRAARWPARRAGRLHHCHARAPRAQRRVPRDLSQHAEVALARARVPRVAGRNRRRHWRLPAAARGRARHWCVCAPCVCGVRCGRFAALPERAGVRSHAHDEWHDPARGRHRRGAGGRGSTSHGQPINRRLYSASVGLYTLSYVLPAAILGGAVSAWGWQAALLSMAPLVMWIDHPIGNADMVLLAALVTPSNLAFVAAAILLPLRRRRAAIVCAALALASMIYGGFAVPAQQSELVRGPAGHLGPGYYAWVTAGALLLWTAFSSRSAA